MWLKRRSFPRIEVSSIRSRLLWHMGVVFSAGLVVLYWAASTYATYAADSSYDQLLAGSAASIAETISISGDLIAVDVPYAALDMLVAAPNDKVFYRVEAPDGRTLTGYADLPEAPGLPETLTNTGELELFDARYRGEIVHFAVLRREVLAGRRTGWIRVQVGQTREARSALAAQLTVRALVPILIMTILAALVVWITVGRAVRPVEIIGKGLSGRDPSNLSPIDAEQAPAEITPLILAMNQFMERLDSNIGILRTFIATVAHQLRTPLTAMLVQLRLAESATGNSAQAAIQAATISGERMARLIDQLLSDALVMHRAEERRFERFDLRRAVEQALQMASPPTWDSDVRFQSTVQSAMIKGDEVMITEAVKNLVHNALTHGDQTDGVIDIKLAKDLKGFSLCISDAGPGMAEDLIKEAGSRFKTSLSDKSGAGLGLAIVSQVAQSHRGSLVLSNRPGGGLLAKLWLPL